ncbi:MAG TPA: murein biosynthesis integral membrane protein MurJ [bacterium]|nr:murein biosynthesis integral membrane protein MurJ [bacterium]HPQ65827.1 murein biosynthesis integral membrane protein MurJ [bacterium]
MRERGQLLKNAGIVSSATMVSRVLGLIRDIATASIFGTSAAWDAFVVAFTIPNLFRRLFGEGAMTAAFVPVFTGYLEGKGRAEAWKLASVVISTLAVVLAALVLAGMAVCWALASWGREESALVFGLSGVMLPYLFFICLVGLIAGLLNSLRHFTVPAFSPVVLNIAWLAALFVICPLYGPRLEDRIFGLALGVLAGGVAQLAVQIPVLYRRGFRFRFMLDFRHPGMRRIILLMGPGIVGLAVFQLNTLVDRVLAIGFLGEGAPSALYYANRLVQLPLGLFGAALATVILPLLSSQAAGARFAGLRETYLRSMKLIFLVGLPSTMGLILLRRPLIGALFQRNQFDSASVQATAWVLLYYSLGLVAFMGLKVTSQVFYALQRPGIPVRAGLAAMAFNLACNLAVVFIPPLRDGLGAGGLALSTALAAFINLGLLLKFLRAKVPGSYRPMWELLGRAAAATAVMSGACVGAIFLCGRLFPGEGLSARLPTLGIPLAASLGVYWASSRLLGIDFRKEFHPRAVPDANAGPPAGGVQ